MFWETNGLNELLEISFKFPFNLTSNEASLFYLFTRNTCTERYSCVTLDNYYSLEDDEKSGAPNENIVQNHLNIALLNVF